MKKFDILTAVQVVLIVACLALTVGKVYAIFASGLPVWAKWLLV